LMQSRVGGLVKLQWSIKPHKRVKRGISRHQSLLVGLQALK
jgi:hypothetical protein